MPVLEFIDPVFAKISPRRSFSMTENERFGLVFAKTGSINSGTGLFPYLLFSTTLMFSWRLWMKGGKELGPILSAMVDHIPPLSCSNNKDWSVFNCSAYRRVT